MGVLLQKMYEPHDHNTHTFRQCVNYEWNYKENKWFHILLETTQNPPKDPTLKTTELLCSRQCLSEILIICPRLSVVSKSSSQISTVILWDFSKLMSHIKYFKRTTRGCNAVLHCVSATLFIVQWIIRLVALREYKVTDKCVAIEHWLLHFPFTSWSGVVSQWIQS